MRHPHTNPDRAGRAVVACLVLTLALGGCGSDRDLVPAHCLPDAAPVTGERLDAVDALDIYLDVSQSSTNFGRARGESAYRNLVAWLVDLRERVAAVVNLVLGLGGTGARLVESFVHLCAAGLGPPQASVAFIDQDQSNGNTLRARTALGKYVAAHRTLRALAGEHPEPSSDLLRTLLDPHPDGADVEACHWVPQRESNATLANLIKHGLMGEGSARDLARTLFHDREGLRMPLNEGYRGRPHVGAAALLAQIETDEFWRSLEDLVQNASRAVRVFLCGSVFGGTGAAVLPTLARRLRQVAEEADRPLFIAGALMLPYFTFPPAEDREANVPTGHESLLQSQSALQYYHSEMEVGGRPYSFDDIYLVGWRRPELPEAPGPGEVAGGRHHHLHE